MNRVMIFTYSSGTLSSVKNLIDEMFDLSSNPLRADDIFYFGVFCAYITYANFDWETYNTDNIEVPDILTSDMTPTSDKINYVSIIIEQVLTGKIEKPEWMIKVEQEYSCFDCYSPSTFLMLKPKNEKYESLGKLLTNFLYSTSHSAVCM